MNKKYYYLIGAIALAVITGLIVKRCNTPTNPIIDNTYNPVIQETKPIVINDSQSGTSQELLLTRDREVIARLQGELRSKINELAKLKPELLISYKQTYENVKQGGKLRDSLSSIITKLLNDARNQSYSEEVLSRQLNNLFTSTIPYKIENKYRYEVGSISFNGTIMSDTLQVSSEPLISVGSKGGFLKRPTYTMTVTDMNPHIVYHGASSILYKPEEKFQYSIGPMAMTDGKDISAGVGINIRKGFLSVSLGYQLVNTKK